MIAEKTKYLYYWNKRHATWTVAYKKPGEKPWPFTAGIKDEKEAKRIVAEMTEKEKTK